MNRSAYNWRMMAGMMLGLMFLARVNAVDVRGYGVFKTQDYLQASTNAPVLQSNWPAYSFSAVVQPIGLFSNQVTSVTVDSPGSSDQLTPPAAGTDQPFAIYFGALSQASVDAFYPTGVYTLRINTAHDGNKVLTLTMPTNSFPANSPRIANFIQAQTIDSLTNFVLTWDAFSGATNTDFISVSIADTNGNVVFRTATFGAEAGLTLLNGTNTSVIIPANKLAAGQIYNGYIYFEKDVVTQTNSYVGAIGLVGFAKATSFSLQTRTVIPPTLAVVRAIGSQFVVRLNGDAGRSYVIQANTNLATANWISVVTNVAMSGSFDYTNTITGGVPRRFFRAQLKP